MPTEQALPPDSPIIQAWEEYKSKPEFVHTVYWAQRREHTNGSLWNAFLSGWQATATALTKLQQAIEAWTDPTFGFNRPPESSLKHLQTEVQELIDAPHDRIEYADCLMLLLDSARRAGISADELITATYEKLETNKKRKWGAPNAEGFCRHIEESHVSPHPASEDTHD